MARAADKHSPFSTMVRRVISRVHLGGRWGAETVTVTRPGESARRIRVAFDLQQDQEGEPAWGERKHLERAEVLIQRQESCPGGGMAYCPHGTKLVRDERADDDRRPYVFLGEVIEQHPEKWRLVFERPRLVAAGGKQ